MAFYKSDRIKHVKLKKELHNATLTCCCIWSRSKLLGEFNKWQISVSSIELCLKIFLRFSEIVTNGISGGGDSIVNQCTTEDEKWETNDRLLLLILIFNLVKHDTYNFTSFCNISPSSSSWLWFPEFTICCWGIPGMVDYQFSMDGRILGLLNCAWRTVRVINLE